MVTFVFHSFRPEHPLIDLRLFKNRELTVSIITMFLFVAAFFGGLLLVPTYFQQIRGESALMAGLLVAPQGIGAMLTMPIAGTLSDRLPVGRIVPVGLLIIVAGMFGLTQVTEDTSYTLLIAELFVLGLGMGATMMPLFTAALKTLKAHEVARGSTLLNINQQIGSSVGVAVISVILTAHLNGSDLAKPAMAATLDPNLIDQVGGAAAVAAGLADAAAAFADTFWVAWVLVALTLVPAFFLPRKHVESRAHRRGAARGRAARRHALTLVESAHLQVRERLSRRICSSVRLQKCRLDVPLDLQMRRLEGDSGCRCADSTSQPVVARTRGRTAAAPAARRSRAATVRVQPVTTWSSTSSTSAPSRGGASGAGRHADRRVTALTRWAELTAPRPGGIDASTIAKVPAIGTFR